MTRAGFAYMGSPYQDKQLEGKRLLVSGGLGYRNRGMFIDLAYVHSIKKYVDIPYRLENNGPKGADVRGIGGNVVVTVGFKI